MKISRIQKNIQFKGFENVISFNDSNSKQNRFAYMSMRLNDNNGYKDLTNWHNIQKEFFPGRVPKDYLSFFAITTDEDTYFKLDDKVLFLDYIANRDEERTLLRGYDLIASITKRLMNRKEPPENEKIGYTLLELKDSLSKIFPKKNLVEDLCTIGALKCVKHHETAEFFNSKISQKLTKYLL